ncbi:MAG: hypothetical protein Q7S87_09690 [Agitococcus sp.]|nr:hypothetical protein [Agitococcus sp.]
MKNFRNISRFRNLTQKGFTLIELAIVGLFLGILAVFAITAFSGTATNTTRANGMFEAAQKIGDNWALAAQSCAIPTDITVTSVGGGAAATVAGRNLSMLVGTAGLTGTTYTQCIASSGIRPLTGMTTGIAGAESIQGFAVTLTSTTTVAGRPAIAVNFAAVPDSMILPLYNHYSSFTGATTATALAASDAADPTIQYGVAAAGVRTLTIVRPL